MSFCGQVLCQRKLIGPCALTIIGNPSAALPAAAPAAPVRNLRREACGLFCWVLIAPPAFGEKLSSGCPSHLSCPPDELAADSRTVWRRRVFRRRYSVRLPRLPAPFPTRAGFSPH